MFRKVIFYLIKENDALHEVNVIAEHLFPTTFHEETEFLSEGHMLRKVIF
jgi:hypothetical protein